VEVKCFHTIDDFPLPPEKVADVVTKVVEREKQSLQGEIRVIFVDDPYIRDLNRRFLNHDFETDVISFPIELDKSNFEGEIYISVDRAYNQAMLLSVHPEEELWRLVIHGTLHLLGYDDVQEEGRQRMFKRQEQYLDEFGLKRKEL